MTVRSIGLAGALAAALVTPAAAQQVPGTVSFAGRVQEAGVAVDGDHEFGFRLFGAPAGGGALWEELHPALPVEGGLVFVELGARTPLVDAVVAGPALYLEIAIDGEPLAPRLPVVSVPYALRAASAADADSLGGLGPERFSAVEHDHDGRYLPLGSRLSCADGEVVTGLGAAGDVACGPGAPASESYSAGAGLALSGTEFSVTFAGPGSDASAARSDHDHEGRYLPLGASLSCAPGSVVTGLGSGGDVTCAPDADRTYAAGTGLDLSGSTFSVSFAGTGAAPTAARSDHGHAGQYLPVGGALTCSAGEKVAGLEPDGDVICAADASETYTAGAGLTLASNQFAVSFAGSGAAASSARSDHGHAGQYLPAGSSLACAAGQQVTGLEADGDVVCGADADTTYSGTSPITVSGGSIGLSTSGCVTGEVWKRTSTGWSCVPDENTTYSAGAGLALSGTTLSVPANGISRGQIADEPGMEWIETGSYTATKAVGTARSLDTTLPAGGLLYVTAAGSAHCEVANDLLVLTLRVTAGGATVTKPATSETFVSTGKLHSLTAQAVFQIPAAGTAVVDLRAVTLSGNCPMLTTSLVAMYFPTRYS